MVRIKRREPYKGRKKVKPVVVKGMKVSGKLYELGEVRPERSGLAVCGGGDSVEKERGKSSQIQEKSFRPCTQQKIGKSEEEINGSGTGGRGESRHYQEKKPGGEQ